GTGYTGQYSFTGGRDGRDPFAGVTLSGSVLYGITADFGSPGPGVIFRLKTNGTGYAVLKTFGTGRSVSGGANHAALALSGNALYGTTEYGGTWGTGSVFKLDLSPLLTIQSLGNAVVLSWTDPTFALQAAPVISGVYTNIPSATSPYTNSPGGGQKFFRLIGN